MPNKNLFVDGNNLLITSGYAMQEPLLRGNPPQDISASLVFLKTLRKVCATYEPNRIWIAWDTRGNTYRRSIEPAYKGTRDRSNPKYLTALNQLSNIALITELLGITQLSHEQVEADDIIAWLVFKHQNDENIILSTDNDLAQLITKGDVTLLSKNNAITKTNFKQKYGITPERFLEWKVIQGDTSDNISGIPRVGTIGAQKLIESTTDWNSLIEALDNKQKADEKKGKIISTSYREILNKNRKLMELNLWERTNNETSSKTWEQLEELKNRYTLHDIDTFLDLIKTIGLWAIANEMPDWANPIIGRNNKQQNLL